MDHGTHHTCAVEAGVAGRYEGCSVEEHLAVVLAGVTDGAALTGDTHRVHARQLGTEHLLTDDGT